MGHSPRSAPREGPRVAIVAPWGRGGASRSAIELARGLALEGWGLELVGAREQDERLPSGPRVRRWPLPSSIVPPIGHPLLETELLGVVGKVLAGSGVELLHAHYALPYGAVAVNAAKGALYGLQKTPIVLSLHGTDVTRLAHSQELVPSFNNALEGADVISVPSRALAAELARHSERKAQLLPGGVDLARFRPQGGRSGPLRLICASGFQPWKRAPRLVRAFASARERLGSAAEGSKLLFLGEGPTQARTRALAHELGLGGAVEFAGAVDAPEHWFAQADLVVSAAAEEAFGLALLEGLACGLPLVATDVGGVRELAGNGAWARLVPADSLDAMAASLADCMARPRSIRELGGAARARAQRFGADAALARSLALYSLLGVGAAPEVLRS